MYIYVQLLESEPVVAYGIYYLFEQHDVTHFSK